VTRKGRIYLASVIQKLLILLGSYCLYALYVAPKEGGRGRGQNKNLSTSGLLDRPFTFFSAARRLVSSRPFGHIASSQQEGTTPEGIDNELAFRLTSLAVTLVQLLGLSCSGQPSHLPFVLVLIGQEIIKSMHHIKTNRYEREDLSVREKMPLSSPDVFFLVTSAWSLCCTAFS
jgi:hypothetical protein